MPHRCASSSLCRNCRCAHGRRCGWGFLNRQFVFCCQSFAVSFLSFQAAPIAAYWQKAEAPQSRGVAIPRKAENWGSPPAPGGGAGFLIAGTGGGFNVLIRKTALVLAGTRFRETPD